VERARILESHRPMHLYPARLGSALPASVARQSFLPSCPSFSLSRSFLLSVSSYIRFFFVRLTSSALSRTTKSLHGLSDAEKERRRRKRRKKKHVLTEGDACLSCASFPHSSLLSTELHTTEKDQVHPAEMHSRFPIRIGDKDVTLLVLQSNARPVCDFDSLHRSID